MIKILLLGIVIMLLMGMSWIACYKFTPRIRRYISNWKMQRLVRSMQVAEKQTVANPSWITEAPTLWAHAGGGHLHTYGNSKEAIADSIARGFKVIEVDADLTSDGVPVLTHRFRPDNQVAFDSRPTLAEFMSTPVNGKYTPLTLKGLFEAFKDYDGFFAIDSWGIARTGADFKLPDYLREITGGGGHIIYLANSLLEAADVARMEAFASVHYSLPEDIDTEGGIMKLGAIADLYAGIGIQSVTLQDREINERTKQVVERMRKQGVHMSICGVETPERCRKWMAIGADVFNTRLMEPSQFLIKECDK